MNPFYTLCGRKQEISHIQCVCFNGRVPLERNDVRLDRESRLSGSNETHVAWQYTVDFRPSSRVFTGLTILGCAPRVTFVRNEGWFPAGPHRYPAARALGHLSRAPLGFLRFSLLPNAATRGGCLEASLVPGKAELRGQTPSILYSYSIRPVSDLGTDREQALDASTHWPI
jgi:hypothetical protein